MLSKDRSKTTSGFFVIPILSQLWEEKNYCERRIELSSWRPVTWTNRHIHLCLFKLGYDVHVLLSSVIYILSGENITAVYTMSRRRWDQNTTQVANRLNCARDTYVWLLHLTPWQGLRTILNYVVLYKVYMAIDMKSLKRNEWYRYISYFCKRCLGVLMKNVGVGVRLYVRTALSPARTGRFLVLSLAS
jgi:hypothetical protein